MPGDVAAGIAAPVALTERDPHVDAGRLLAELVPPPRFDSVRFSTYVPDPAQPSQSRAVRALEEFAAGLGGPAQGTARRRWFRGKAPERPATPGGIYLDGGYGVGKTHLLASLWHATDAPPARKAFGTFVELTNLVGALGFRPAVDALSSHRLVCIDEFELDDPGDTVLVSTLLARLAAAGVRLAATSNTLPGKLGEGRFAAADFMREIQGLSERFTSLRIDGDDYRHRGAAGARPVQRRAGHRGRRLYARCGARRLRAARGAPREGASQQVRGPRRRDRRGFPAGVRQVTDQAAALRLVVLADRLYDREVPVMASGVPFDQLFSAEMLRGGYRKKYFRAVSRLTSLAREASRLP